MWAGQNWDTTPDIMCLAKGIAGRNPNGISSLPSRRYMDAMKVGEHSSTFGGSPWLPGAGNSHAGSSNSMIN